MSEDPTRAMPAPGTPAKEVPSAYGRVGPADPHADPATHPGFRPPDVDGPATDPGFPPVPRRARPQPPEAPTAPTASRQPAGRPAQPLGRAVDGPHPLGHRADLPAGVHPPEPDLGTISFLGSAGAVPVGVALLLAAIAGLLLVAIPGGVRMMQLRRAARRAARR